MSIYGVIVAIEGEISSIIAFCFFVITMQYPQHIAIIPDGNRTRATDQGLAPMDGHVAGQENSIALMRHIFTTTPISTATFWGLSTENTHQRSPQELSYLFRIYKEVLDDMTDFLLEQHINFQWVGNPDGLPADVIADLNRIVEMVTCVSDRTIIFALNYGGRDELIRGIQAWHDDGDKPSILTEEVLSSYLDFADVPPVDLIIRTKGDVATRLSGFMLWWSGYAELYFTHLKFPAFTPGELDKALQWFDQQVFHRNFGK